MTAAKLKRAVSGALPGYLQTQASGQYPDAVRQETETANQAKAGRKSPPGQDHHPRLEGMNNLLSSRILIISSPNLFYPNL